MKKIRTLTVVAFALITCLVFSSSVIADNAGLTKDDYQSVSDQKLSAEEMALIEEQNADAEHIVELFNDAKKTGETIDEKSDCFKALQNYAMKWKNKKIDIDDLVLPMSTKSIYSVVLGVDEVEQEKYYYCGPASAYQLLDYLGITSHPDDSRSLTQDNLADDLNTNIDGTGFFGMYSTLNDWTNSSAYSSVWHPSETTVWSNTVTNCYIDDPLIYDTHMCSSTAYLVGYSSDTYHYVTGDGYKEDTSGPEYIHYVDPNGNNNDAYGPHWILLEDMADAVGAMGMVR